MAEMMHKGVIYSLETAFRMLMAYRVVFFGEQHDSPEAHRAELELLTGLAGLDPEIILALEMFERDVQKGLNDYLGGEHFRGGVPETITSLAELRDLLPAADRILQIQGHSCHCRQHPPPGSGRSRCGQPDRSGSPGTRRRVSPG